MAPLRLRHSNGIATLDIPLDSPDFTVNDLQQQILAITNIIPSRQILKSGYPPRPLELIPELPLQSLGLQRGDQIILSESTTAISRPVQSSAVPQSASAATTSTSFTQPSATSNGPDHVQVDGSFLVHRIVPDDNSCLFSSAALIFEQDMTKAPELRQIVAQGIQKDPETYNDAILGMAPSKYIATITKPSSWGGAIELGILAAHYQAEIASIDVETGRIDYFSPGDHGNGMRCIMIYSGIHYDAASLAPSPEAPAEWHQTLFPIKSNDGADPIIAAATKLATILRGKKAFTNTATFDLKCEQCGQGLKGEKGARAHAEATGHVRFGEY
ncbi:hypothetical protein CVT24_005915 [Panaeolus cyanescens]|uniref:Ubiquitin thioesterase OTU n=1 Tax=Panaeolus cyanescens TaxID=181874 RepID=A0A409VDJ5_9AGAR|nr:hypothetical protein CVT24_005915 [Panaeolus cyanescens]